MCKPVQARGVMHSNSSQQQGVAHRRSHKSCSAQGSPEAAALAASALCHLVTRPAIARPLFSAPALLDTAVETWLTVVDMCGDGQPRAAHGALVAVARMLSEYAKCQDPRDKERHEALVAVLAHFAWSAVLRLRVGAAHVLDTLLAMPSHMQARSPSLTTAHVAVYKFLLSPPRAPSLDERSSRRCGLPLELLLLVLLPLLLPV